MGGYGSGWQGAKKATVEGSLVLTASSLVRKKALVPGYVELRQHDGCRALGKGGDRRHGR